MRLPKLYPIVDKATLDARGIRVSCFAGEMARAGVGILQYRDKLGAPQEVLRGARAVAEAFAGVPCRFVLNDRADFARLLKTALHVGQEDLPAVAARQIVSDEVIGFSTHNAEQLKRGDAEPVEYLSIGPIFATTSKLRPDPAVGIEGLKSLRALTQKPLCAIGGITLANVGEVFAAKADSVAVISGIVPEICNRKALKARTMEWLAAG